MPFFDLPPAELERYLPGVAEPPDLDEFWSRTLAEARAAGPCEGVGTDGVLLDVVPAETGLTAVTTSDITFAGYGGHPVRAWATRPAGVGPDVALPAVVEYLGYGRGRGLPHERLVWAAAGYQHLVMDSRGQGSMYGSGGSTPDPAGTGPAAPGVVTRGIEDPETYYYRRLITDAVRAVDAVRALPGVDPARVATVGNSQGGGLALAVAGLVPDLRAVMPSVPFMCHPRRALEITGQHPYGEILQYLSVHRDPETVFRTLSYVDGVVLGRRARAAALFAVGLQDTICPPSTVFAAYNHYGSLAGGGGAEDSAGGGSPGHRSSVGGSAHFVDRRIEVYPYNHHEGGDAHHVARQLTWLATHL